jgi:hypothetical protein
MFLQGPLIPILIDQLQGPIYAIAVSRHLPVCHIALATGRNVVLAIGGNNGEVICPFYLEFSELFCAI